MADYPSSIYTPRTIENKTGVVYDPLETKTIFAEDRQNDDAEIIAIQNELGLNPKSTSASVKEKIYGIRSLSGASADVIVISGGNVGIGTTAPENLVHIKVNDAGIAPHASANLVVEDTGTNYLQMLTDNASVTGIIFGDTNDVDVGKVVYDHNRNDLELFAGGTELITLDGATGNVGIGDKSPEAKLDVLGSSIYPIYVKSSGTQSFVRFLTGSTTARGSIGYSSAGSAGLAFLNAASSAVNLMVTDGGSVGVGTTSPANSALLDLTSTTKALLLTRMTTTQRNALTAVNGMVIYNTTTNAFNFYENGSWVSGSGLI